MIILKKEFLEQIVSQARKELPNEACGILAGPPSCVGQNKEDSVRRITRIYEMANVDKSPSSYFMDPEEQLKVTKEIRNQGLEMVGIYHSHVASPARPSVHDIEMAFYQEAAYVIISLADRNKPGARAFRIVEGKVEEEELKIE